MSEHHAKVVWSRNEVDFSYQTYSRDHIWSFPGGVEVPASAAPEFLGSEQRVDPEEAFIAALSSCHMLTFLAIAAKKKIVIEEYQDEAVGFLEKNDMGKLSVTRVVLRPRVTFAQGSAQTKEQLDKLHHSAHENCFIANSVNTQVTVEA
jgi:organic hydroperoxide reductase OsmC/OhrA